MAYGLNWFSEFADIEEKVFRVEILKRDFVGTAIEVISSGNPIKLSWSDDAASNPWAPVRSQKAEIQWISEEISGFDISDIFVIDQQEYKVRFGELNGEDFSILWEGYLVPTDCREPYQAKPYPVDMSAICSLALMKDQYFLDENGRFVEGVESLMNILINCLAQTKLELGIDVYIGLLEISAANPIVLSQTYIDTDGLRGMTCYEVLEGIMNSINAYITQENGRWAIKGIRELVAENITKRSFNHDGSGYTSSTVSQISTIGRNPMGVGVPNLFPTKNVDESIATPSSVITNTVSPGIAVNRLTNGIFNPAKSPWGVNLGLMDGWAYSPEPKGYRVEGEGRPDDPYRFIMIGSVKTIGDIVYRTSGASQKGTAIYNTPVITIHRDGGKDSYPNIKIVVSGAFRARDGGRLLIACRFNDGDKDYVQWLDENGNWTKAKKDTDRTAIKVTVDTPHNPEAYVALKDLPLQTFEVTSSKIPDYLDRPGGWIAKLYFSIHPITVGSDNFPEVSNNFSPAVWLEDIAVSVTTETAYEGEHYYQIESDTLIRNGEEYEYKTIVADKINILTAEQKRDENRVMTGYSSVGIANLTKGWKRFVNGYSTVGAHEPLQHLTLRERLRLLCGKRRVLEGEFYGYGIKPSHAVINLFDGGTDSYHTITGYSWDVKNRIYNLRLHQLDFPVLSKEVISLKKDRKDNGRGNRMYQGASGSVGSGNGGNSASDSDEQIVLDSPDNYDYTVLKADTSYRICDVGPLIQSGHAPELLEAKIIVTPDWLTEISIYRGEDIAEEDRPEDGILEIHWKGKPPITGNFQIVVELSTADGADYLMVIPIRVFPKTVTTATLLDKISGAAVIVGTIPGLYFVPDISDIAARIKGTHNKVVMSLSGGGPAGNSINESRTVNTNYQVDDFTYEMFLNEGGFVLLVGSYTFTVESYFENVFRSSQVIKFTLYDEEYLAKYSAELWDTTQDQVLGVIEPDGSSVFKAPVSFDIKSILSDFEHDKVVLTLTKDGVVLPEKIYTLTSSEFEGEYNFFDEVTTEYGPGAYELVVDVFLATTQVYQRLVIFEIANKEVLPEAGIQLISFTENTVNYEILADLPLNNSEFDLPDAYGFKIPVPVVDFDHQEWKAYDKTSGSLLPIDIETYTNKPQYVDYTEGETPEDILVFDLKNSTQIGRLHRAPSAVRVVSIFKKGGAAGDIVAIVQADVSFRVPLNPEDYSGLRFITFDADTSVQEVTDANMPISGRTYILPVYPKYWSVAARSYNGQLFDEVTLELKKDGVFLHSLAGAYVSRFTSSTPVTELEDDLSASIFGYPTDDERRYLINPSGEQVLIDDLGEVEIIATFKLAGVLVGVLDTTFSFADAEEDLPIVTDDTPQWVKDITQAEIDKWNTIDDYVLTADFPDLFDDRFYTNLLTGYVVGTNTAIVATDNLLSAFGKIQAQLNAKQSPLSGTGIVKSTAGVISYITDNSANWNTAYGWGNHAGLYAPISHVGSGGSAHAVATISLAGFMSASDKIALNTVVSGSSDYMRRSVDETITGTKTFAGLAYFSGPEVTDLNSPTGFRFVRSSYTPSNSPSAGFYQGIQLSASNNSLYANQLFFNDGGDLFTRTKFAGSWSGWSQLALRTWVTAGNGLIKSTGGVLSYITDNSDNWNTAYTLSHPALTIGASGYGLSVTGQVLNFQAANATQNGALTAADWITFNDKQANIIAGTTAQYYRGDKTFQTLNTSVVPELTNLYYTDARSRAAISGTGVISYNSTTGQISYTGGAGLGTVTSVGLSVPAGFTVSGSPVTSAGTIGISFASGYSLPSNATQANWDAVYLASSDYMRRSVDETVTANKIFTGIVYLTGPEVTDINTPTGFRLIRSSSTPTNGPVSGYVNGVQFSTADNTNYINQLLSTISGDWYVRTKNAGTWGGWDQLAMRGWVTSGFTPISHVGSGGSAHAVATTSLAGFMSAGDKVILNNLYTDSSEFIKRSATETITGAKFFTGIAYFPGPEVTDLNAPTGTRFVRSSYAPSNSPGAGFYQGIQLSAADNTDYINQLFFNDGGDLYTRTKYAGSWGSWSQLASRTWVTAQGYKTTVTSGDVTGALGYTPYNATNPAGYISGINSGNVISALGYTPYNVTNPAGYITPSSANTLTNKFGNISMWTNDVGYITAINSGNVISALGYTPYNSSNPAGYISGINSGNVTSALGYTPMRDDRTITINGNTQNIRDNPNFTITSSGGTITGSGTTNYVPVWNSSSGLTNSRITDYGSGNIGLNGDTYVTGNFTAAGYTFLNVVGIGGTSGNDASAILQINSNTKGFLMPRMTYAQRMAISSPAVGLEVFQTDTSGSSPIGVKVHVGSGVWTKNTVTFD